MGFTQHVAAKGLGPNSVRLALGPVRAMLGDAVQLGLIRSNPALGIRVSLRTGEDDGEAQTKALSDEELARLVAAVPEQWRPLIVFLSETGLRISEAIALTWEDIDLGQKQLHVRRRIYRGQAAPPKSRYGRRSVPLSAHVARDLWQRRGGASDSALVWPNRDGGYLDPGNMHGRWLKKAARAAGVPWAGFHTLRHSCATNLFRLGLNAKQAQIWLGHHSPAFTMAVYTHLLSDDLPPSPFAAPPEGGNGVATRPAETGRDAAVVAVAETA